MNIPGLNLTEDDMREIYYALRMVKRNTILLDSFDLTGIMCELEDKFDKEDTDNCCDDEYLKSRL